MILKIRYGDDVQAVMYATRPKDGKEKTHSQNNLHPKLQHKYYV